MSAAGFKQARVTTQPASATGRTTDPDRQAFVESWRVLTDSAGSTATADAIVRLRSGGDRLVVTGEAATPDAALLDALQAAGMIIPDSSLDLGTSLPAHLRASSPSGNLTLEAAHNQGLVGRLAVMLNAHDVTSFSYRLHPEKQLVAVEMTVQGGDWHVSRVAHKLRRVIGVRRVTAKLAEGDQDTVLVL